MKAVLYDGSRRLMVDTQQDICLLSQNHRSPQQGTSKIYQKDLYQHKGTETAHQNHYYFHIHPAGTTGKDKFVLVTPVMAERYLMQLGITCTEFPRREPVSRLYNWGYGIAEEF